ncbi:MAG: hypothetical protein GC179_11915 [Anaerolineaceae bacterium]|nr:hypothetical protein [Anaerolineaceae bacterium]
MAHQFEWIIPQRVVLTRIIGEISPDETTEIILESRERTSSGQSPVHFIIDVSALAQQSFSLPKLNEWSSLLPSNTSGWWVLINPNSITMFAISLITKALHVKLKSAQSLEEAIHILQKIDQTLVLTT